MVFIEALGEGERGAPWGLNFNPWFDALQTLPMLLVAEHLIYIEHTFIFCETTLFPSALCHIVFSILIISNST